MHFVFSIFGVGTILNEVSYVHQGCIYLIKNTGGKNSNILKCNYNAKWLFSILIYFKM